jgi:non-ribosomal peptide synthetase component F
MFMLLLAAFQTLLYRYTGQEDIIIGTGIANRTHVQLEHLIGCFFNILALRGDLKDNPTFAELLRRTRDISLGAYAHQEIPFEYLLEHLRRDKDSSRSPIFHVMFVLQNLPVSQFHVPGLTLSLIPIKRDIAKFDLTLFMDDGADGISGSFEYSTDLFDRSTIVRMIEHFINLCRSVIEDPEREINNVTLATSEDDQHMVYSFNEELEPY